MVGMVATSAILPYMIVEAVQVDDRGQIWHGDHAGLAELRRLASVVMLDLRRVRRRPPDRALEYRIGNPCFRAQDWRPAKRTELVAMLDDWVARARPVSARFTSWRVSRPNVESVVDAMIELSPWHDPFVAWLDTLDSDGLPESVLGCADGLPGGLARAHIPDPATLFLRQGETNGWLTYTLLLPLVAACKRAREPGSRFESLVILKSIKQGIGKTTYWLAVNPNLVGEDATLTRMQDGFRSAEVKSMVHVALGSVFMLLDEFRQIDRRALPGFKQYLTTEQHELRFPFRRDPESVPVSWVHVAATNDPTPLASDGENRRFLVADLGLGAGFDNPKAHIEAWCDDNRERLWAAADHIAEVGWEAWAGAPFTPPTSKNATGWVSRARARSAHKCAARSVVEHQVYDYLDSQFRDNVNLQTVLCDVLGHPLTDKNRQAARRALLDYGYTEESWKDYALW